MYFFYISSSKIPHICLTRTFILLGEFFLRQCRVQSIHVTISTKVTESTVIDTEQRPPGQFLIFDTCSETTAVASCVLRYLVWSQWRQQTHAKPQGGDLLADKPAWLHLPRISIKRPNNHRIGKRLGYQNFYKNFYKRFKTTQQQQNRQKIRI